MPDINFKIYRLVLLNLARVQVNFKIYLARARRRTVVPPRR
ncbi:hypothetical protein [uncultured Campylobacter sp.]|nr:hypothetical protein [uncultured Campylobacter sp.]